MRWLLFAFLMGSMLMPASRARAEGVDDAFEKHVFDPGGAALPYRLLRPAKLKTGVKYPLVLFFHGAGERGDDNVKQLVHGMKEFVKDVNRTKHPCFVVAPQCPAGTWWSAPTRSKLAKPAARLHRPLESSMALLDSLEREFPIDAARIYVTGLSMGGYATWDLILHHPDRFAAAAPICGGGDVAQAGKLAQLPIWAFHGEADKAVPVALTRGMIDAIRKAGGKPRYTEYAGVGHDSWTRTYADPKFIAWLFAQKKS